MNPYTNRAMITHRKFFFNRKSEIRKVFSRIGSEIPQSVSIVGMKKTGKSSLLFYIFSREIAQEYIKNINDYIFAFVDLQERKSMNVEQFFDLVQREIRAQMPDDTAKHVSEAENTYGGFHQTMEALDSMKKKIVIFLDEFEVVVRNKNFGPEFYSFLRSQASSFNVAYVISSREELFTFYKRKEIEESNFWNIFTSFWVGLFDRESSLELIRTLSSEEGYPLEEYSDFILRLAGDHPFYLQIACCAVFDFLACHEGISEKDFEQIENEFKTESWNHFNYLWDKLIERERKIVYDLAMGKKVEDSNEIQTLENKGILKKEKDGYSLFSETFSEFVREEKSKGSIVVDKELPSLPPPSPPLPLSPYEFSQVFSSKAREKILRYLAENEAKVKDLVDLLGITRPAVETHLRMLLGFDLIKMRPILSPRIRREYSISKKGRQVLEVFEKMEKKMESHEDSDFLEVRVGPALTKDEGKHIARISKSTKEKMGIESGSLVILESKDGKSVQCEAKTLRGEKGDKVLLDGETMLLLDIKSNDTVILKKKS